MKKLNLIPQLLLLLLLQVTTSMAQTQELPILVDFENFYGTNLAEAYPGWNEASGFPNPQTFGSGGWYASSVLFEGVAAGISLNGDSRDEWIISPTFQATEHSKVSFRAALTRAYDDPASGFMGFDDSVSVMCSFNGSEFFPLFSFTYLSHPAGNYNHYDVDLGQFAGEQIKIAFFATEGNEMNGFCAFHLDDIKIKNAGARDAAAIKIISPVANECYVENQDVIVKIKNDGFENLQGVPVRVKVRGAQNFNIFGVCEQTIAPGTFAEFTVGQVDMSIFGEYNFELVTELKQDSDSGNNSVTAPTVINTEPFELPLQVLHFTNFYTDNLSEVHPGWYEARGKSVPVAIIDTDWQSDLLDEQITASVYYIGIGTEDWLVGPRFVASTNTEVRFVAGIEQEVGTNMGSDDKFALMVSTNCGSTWSEVACLDASSGLSSLLNLFSFDLSSFAGQEIRVAFYATTGPNADEEKYVFHVDNIAFGNFFDYDIGVSTLISPANNCAFTTNEQVSVEITNFGNESMANFSVAYSLNNGENIIENVAGTLQAGQSFIYSFNQTADLTQSTENFIDVWTIAATDQNNQNNGLNDVPVYLSSFDLASEGTFETSFENNENLDSWSIENGNNDTQLWTRLENSEHARTGAFSYYYSSNNTTQQSNDWLYSPCFNLIAGETYYVSFYYKNRATSYPESLRLMLGTSQNQANMNTALINLGQISNSNYLQAQTTFSVTVSGEYYFGWHANGEADRFAMHIDDVEIYQIFTHDLALSNVFIPRITNENCELQNPTSAFIEISNIGNETINSFTVEIQINSQDVVSQVFNETLISGQSSIVEFTNGFNISVNENYNISANVINNEDFNTANNFFVLENYKASDYHTSFETNDNNNEWTNVSSLGNSQWTLLNNVDLAHSGEKLYGIRTDGANGNITNDDWLLSNCFNLEPGKCYSLDFYYRSHYSTENLEIFIGNSPNIYTMSSLIQLPDFNSNTYLHFEHQFTVDTQGTYYFAWRTTGGTSGRYWIYIDDISIKESFNSPVVEISNTVLDNEVLFFANTQFVDSYLWNFGDGQSSSEQNPSHIYSEPGTYQVSLTAGSACGEVVVQTEIEIECTLTAGFNFTITNSNVSFVAQGNATGFLWNFGDGNYGAGTEILHNYPNQEADYNVELEAIAACGSVMVEKNVSIDYTFAVSFDYTISGTSVSFFAADGAISYNWNFGDGNTSTEQNPVHLFLPQGSTNYTVTLEATDGMATGTATANLTLGCNIDLEMNYEIEITNVSFSTNTVADSYLWNFGDGTSAAEQNPNHTYFPQGTTSYMVNLQVINNCGFAEIEEEITIECDLIVDFNYTQSATTFIFNTDFEADSYLWNFGDNNYSPLQNPSHLYFVSEATNFTVTLTVETPCGTFETSQNIVVEPTGLSNIDNHDFIIFPNPTSGIIDIYQSQISENTKISVIDEKGTTVATFNFEGKTNNSDMQLDLSALNAGTYFIKFETNEHTNVSKIIIKK